MIIKIEFVRNQTFSNLYELKYKLADYVNWGLTIIGFIPLWDI
ncbi:IS3 family transposase [Anaerotignum sp.]